MKKYFTQFWNCFGSWPECKLSLVHALFMERRQRGQSIAMGHISERVQSWQHVSAPNTLTFCILLLPETKKACRTKMRLWIFNLRMDIRSQTASCSKYSFKDSCFSIHRFVGHFVLLVMGSLSLQVKQKEFFNGTQWSIKKRKQRCVKTFHWVHVAWFTARCIVQPHRCSWLLITQTDGHYCD